VRLSMLSLLAVFKDVLPGYRIRLPTEKELAMPVSKDVKRTRDYEATLLRLYQVNLHIWCCPGIAQQL
jgi:nucleolar complex protein 3